MRYLIVVCFSILALVANAENVSVKQAEMYAMRFFGQHKQYSRGTNLKLVWEGGAYRSRNGSDSPAFYVFNRENNKGFVIISGTDATRPVLAYASEGSFSTENMPDNIKVWMNALAEGVKQKEWSSMTESDGASKWERTLDVGREVDLDTPNWDQDSPYNLKCPVLYGRHCYTGCTMTATAIVLGYHRWPDRGRGVLPKYVTGENGFRLGPIELGEEYKWNKMPFIDNNLLDEADQEQAEAISTIMFHLGVMARADYSLRGTTAFLERMAEGLPVYMRYNPKLKFLEREHFSDEVWSKMLRDEIDGKRPVIYEGYGDGGGHAFVIDGYNNAGYFNVNWGWGGYNNGFYLLDQMLPGYQGAGGNVSGSYNLSQGGIFGLEPRLDSEVEIDNLQFIPSKSFASGLEVDGLELPAKKGDKFWVDAGVVRNMGTNDVNGTLKLAMTDAEGNVVEGYLEEEVREMAPNQTVLVTYYKLLVEIQREVKPGYRLRLLFKAKGSEEWKPVTCDKSVGQWEVVLCEGESQKGDSIDEATSLSYDRQSGIVAIVTLEGVKGYLKELVSGKDCSSVISYNGDVLTIKSKQLKRGAYVLSLRKGTDVKDLVLEF